MCSSSRLLAISALTAIVPVAAYAATSQGHQVSGVHTDADVFVSNIVSSVSLANLAETFHDIRDAVLEWSNRAPESTPIRGVDAGPRPGETRPAPRTARELPVAMRPEIAKFVDFYTKGSGRATAEQGLARAEGLRERADTIFREEGVPADLIWLAMVESGWKPTAISPVGAAGVWQFMPGTAKDFGMRVDEEVDERLDFEKATRGAARYLRRLARCYHGNWELAIAVYNVGEGNVDEAIEEAGVHDF